ncbi:sensor histidine kinase [Cohnella caldifontis]|uniref:sensor histidine kinase n=1 Tax=Cohnella caldifontis TaxID=3027471 RepID=UPI0023EB8AF9|nr:ATP-binding protein [Cohnella sp. YIM B05605]
MSWKSIAKWTGTAGLLFAMNGWINLALMKPLPGGSEAFYAFRSRLDDAAFVLIFLLLAIVFWAMFAFLPRERGYSYLGTISLLTALQLFLDWDQKSLLFGPMPDIPHASLVVKSGIVFLFFSFIPYLLRTGKKPMTRVFRWAGGGLWTVIAAAWLCSAGDFTFGVLNALFLAHLFLNMALCVGQFLALLRRPEHQAELRFIGAGFLLFTVILLPDPVKDVMEQIQGRVLGYRMSFWEECFEDTFAWALLALLSVFGIAFFHRFVQTVKDNRAFTEELRRKHEALEQEAAVRHRLDQWVTELLGTYRIGDLEQVVVREGRRYFHPNAFALAEREAADGFVRFIGEGAGLSSGPDFVRPFAAECSKLKAGETAASSSLALGAVGNREGNRLFLAVFREDGGPLELAERDKFAFRLMAKYVSLLYEYFQMIDHRFKEIEQQQAERAPWLSKLFMQIAEKERRRLASDLHDETLQELLHLRRLLDRAAADRGERELLEPLRIGLENAEFMIRETCSELMPSFLSEQGVLRAVSRLVEKTRLRADFQLEFRAYPFEAVLSDEQSTAVYRVAQELINNAVKHSGANRVDLEIRQESDRLQVRYADDGKGMAAEEALSSTEGLGLRGVQERIRMLGGDMTLKSRPGAGVTLECRIPV